MVASGCLARPWIRLHPSVPAIVTLDELGDPRALRIRCTLNGSAVQDSSTSQLMFKTEDLVHHISRYTALFVISHCVLVLGS